jgi:glycosyltransferase involved in cell wall biosynthesis
MTRMSFAIPGDINLPTGGYTYARRVLPLFAAAGIDAAHLELPGTFPDPSPADLAETERLLASTPSDAVLLVDGLAYGALPADLISRLRDPIVALVHHPLCLEAGLSQSRQKQLYELEKAALAFTRRIVVTSTTTARTLTNNFAVPAAKITVAEPGTDRASRARGTGNPPQLLAVGSIVPRKAYDVLVQALAPLAARDWRLSIVGATDRSPEALAALESAIGQSGLADRIKLAGPAGPAALDAHYDAADLFVMSSLYEGYGMVLGEAMARGLPIVCTTGGAAADTAPDAAALKVPPGDAPALSDAIARLLDDAALRHRMADAAWAAGQSLPGWERTAALIAEAVKDAAQ